MNILLLTLVLLQDAPRGGKIDWRRDVDEALASVGRDRGPAVLYFTDDR